jgi:hypothetical protein
MWSPGGFGGCGKTTTRIAMTRSAKTSRLIKASTELLVKMNLCIEKHGMQPESKIKINAT